MRAGERFVGWEALHRHTKQNYHIIDKNGQAVYCGCMPSIRYNGEYMWMKVHRRSKAHRLEQWYKQYRFESNIERSAERRTKHADI